MTPLDLIEERLHAAGCHPVRRGDNLTARCPAHNDNNPSLSVSPGRTRDIAIHCHAGCAATDVLTALNLTWTDFGDKKTSSGPGRVVATYRYTDADGRHLYDVLRYHPKTFRQRRANGEWNLGNTPKVLYQLPAVTAAVTNGQPVWITEGEKDADALTAAGVTATCNSGGAGKFELGHAEPLAGAHCVIVADRDQPGHDHAAQVAALLSLVGATWQVVEAAEGKDAADHLAAGHGLDEFVPIDVDATDDLADAGTTTHPLERFLVDWPALFAGDHDTHDWILEPLFARARGHALYAGAKTGKSWVLLCAALHLATGRPFLDHPGGDPTDVLYVDYEMTAEDLRDRVEEFGFGPDDDLTHFHYALLPTIDALDTTEGGTQLVESALAVGAQFVLIDTTSRAVAGEENSADTFRHFYRCTGLPLKQAGIGYVRADHAGKDADRGQRGSSAKNDDVDVVIQLTNREGGKLWKATHRRMSWYPESTVLHVGESNGVTTISGDGAATWPAGTAEVVADLDELGVPLDATKRDAMAALRDAGKGRRQAVVLAALRFRQGGSGDESLPPVIHSPEGRDPLIHRSGSGTAGPTGTHPEKPNEYNGTQGGTHADPPSRLAGPDPGPPIGGPGTHGAQGTDDDDLDTFEF